MQISIPNVGHVVSTRTGWAIELASETSVAARAEALNNLCTAIAEKGGGRAEFWIENVQDFDDDGPRNAGFSPYRDLLQMRVSLPVDAPILDTRAFRSSDADAVVSVNNRAFSWHPEQSGMTRESLAERQAEPWYDADGFRIFERDGRIAGFCWTKVHTDVDPPVGEIYVIGVDPDFHGQGLGLPLTAAGLKWLEHVGLTVAILYVESDNHPAVRTYRKLGFGTHQTNRAYERLVEAST